jgi:nitroimidazol reductase NimA-like FMN-containing flavoprotein (pyridoxamine 5'-phosphate oxidase superfamily)
METISDTSKSYPITARNRVKRFHETASYDRTLVHGILDAGMLCHVAYVIAGEPYCTPTLHWRIGDWLYWHGSSASRMLKTQKPGARVCVTVSHLDGLVLARSGFNHSVNYRSVMCFGEARIIEGAAKEAALLAVVDRFYPGRNADLRAILPQEAKATMVVGMLIEEASAKVNDYGVRDEEADYTLPIWAGVIPVTTVLGAVEDCPRVLPEVSMPEGLADYAEGRRLDEVFLEMQAKYEAGE